jgi:class 3 adenylate cyclase
MSADDLKRLRVFEGVAPDVITKALPRPAVRTFLPGEMLFKRNEIAEGLFVILRGTVLVDFDGTSLVARGEQDLVGEQALLTPHRRRTASASAQNLVSVLWIPEPAFRLLTRDTPFAFNIARALSAKLSQATADRGYRYSKEAEVFGEFRAHVSRDVLDRLLQEGPKYGSPRTAPAIVLFSDIRNFTRLSGAMAPARIARELSAYLDHVVAIVHEHRGMVDKFVGDAVMAVWGAFEDLNAEHAQLAFDCANHMVRTAGEFTFGDHPVAIGVGLNAGTVFIGNVGGNDKRQFTVLGAPVNLAARFEAATKELSVPLVLGEAMTALLAPSVRAALVAHRGLEIKGAGVQAVFSVDPMAGCRGGNDGMGQGP